MTSQKKRTVRKPHDPALKRRRDAMMARAGWLSVKDASEATCVSEIKLYRMQAAGELVGKFHTRYLYLSKADLRKQFPEAGEQLDAKHVDLVDAQGSAKT